MRATTERRRWLVCPLLVLVALAATAACGDSSSPADGTSGALTVRGASVDLPVNDRQAVVRMVVDNRSGGDDRLVAASSPVAEAASVHESMTDDAGRSTMEERPGLAIPAGDQVFFSPGSYHVMLERLRQPLEVGDEVALDLEFERAGTVRVVAVVTELPVN